MFEGTLYECSCWQASLNRFFIWMIVFTLIYFLIKYWYALSIKNFDLKLITTRLRKNVGEKE